MLATAGRPFGAPFGHGLPPLHDRDNQEGEQERKLALQPLDQADT